MKYGDLIQLPITGLDHKGRGFGVLNERRIVIPKTIPGDEVTATFVKRDSGDRIARLQDIKTASPDRVPAPCPHADICGGCLWQHMGYEAQVKHKADMINRALEKAGHVERVENVEPCVEPFGYRNRMDFVFGPEGQLGLKEYGSWNRYVDVKTCLLMDKKTDAILDSVKKFAAESGLKPWDARTHEGDLRYCVVRRGVNTEEHMVMLLVKDLTRVSDVHRSWLIEHLSPLCTTLLLGENPTITDLSLASTIVHLAGKPELTEEVNGIRYTIHPNSFFQTNTRMAAKLQDAVLASLSDAKRALDLYCGLGFFGIAAAKQGAQVYGHELDAPAIELARINAEQNGVAERCEFAAGPVEKLDWKEKQPDAVIIDPPRAGLHPKALEALLENAPPKIIYVSCNYHRLAEELKQLKTKYRVERVQAFDLFPHTPHVEVIATLTAQ
jgi:23S rRNA (uracil1939-C5)-methyltransferase